MVSRLFPVLFVALLLTGFAHAQVRMTEFLATNTTGITDEDGERHGWIELWNPSQTQKVALGSFRLVHGDKTWIFPGVHLAAKERMLIWASGKDRKTATAPLHTNFTIDPAEGGTVQLQTSTGAVVSQFSNYPEQFPNVSYGRDLIDGQSTAVIKGYYTQPTPGEANNYVGTGVAGGVEISPPSRAFTSTLEVTLTQKNPHPDAQIRFTTNGQVPTPNSALYSGPFTVSSTQLIRARVFQTDLLPGETASESYLRLDTSVGSTGTANFSSPIPIIVISNFTGGTPPDDGDQPSFMWVFEPGADGRARLTDQPVIASRTVIDRRGSSTLGNPKWNLNLETRRPSDEEEQDVELLGMPAHSDWVLHAPYSFDRALMRNAFIYALSNQIGRYAVRSKMAEVFIDSEGGTLTFLGGSQNYFGVYNVMEKIRRGSDRVNVRRMDPYDNDSVKQTGGFIVKVDRRDSGDSGFSTPRQGTFCYYYPRETVITTAQRTPQKNFLVGWLTQFDNSCYLANYTDPTVGYRKYLDIGAAIDHHLLNTWPMNVDALRLSAYMHKERGGKLVYGPIWDFDRSMSSTDGRDSNPATWRGGGDATDFFNYTWWNRLFSDINFYQEYIDRWVELRRGKFSQANVNALLDQLNNEITAEAAARDLSRWAQPKRSWTSPFTGQNFTGQTAEVQRIKDWLQQRANFMDSQWVPPVTIEPASGNYPDGTTVTMTGPPGATIYYTLDGSDPRNNGNNAPTGSNVHTYTGPFQVTSTTRIRARARNQAWLTNPAVLVGSNSPPLRSAWSGYTDARFSTDVPAAPGNLIVSEIYYNPPPPTPDELAVNPVFNAGAFEYLELRNIGNEPVDLAGVQLESGVRFSITHENAVSLPPGGHAIIAGDVDAFRARFGEGTTVLGRFDGDLSNGGEQLVLRNGATQILAFEYDDAWYPATDGPGKSLVVYDPLAEPFTFNSGNNWRESAEAGGSPGYYDANSAPLPMPAVDAPTFVDGMANMRGTFQGGYGGTTDPTAQWSQVSGPGEATFEDPSAFTTKASFTLPGHYTLRMTIDDGVIQKSADIAVAVKDTLEHWQARHPGIGDLTEDFDLDGVANFGEYALALNPEVPDVNIPPLPGVQGNFLTITYTRLTPPSEVIYTVELANEIDDWHEAAPGEVTEEILSDDGLTQVVKVTDIVDLSSQPSRFIRLKISKAP